MATNYSPKIVTDGLVLCLDAANLKSFRGEPTENLFQNPLLIGETGLASGWASYNATYEVVSETFNNGEGFSQRFYGPPGGSSFRNSGIRLNFNATVSQIYTLSFYGKNLETETSISYFSSGWSNRQSSSKTLNNGWKFYTITLTASSTSTILYIRPNGNNKDFGFDSLIYKPQLETKPYSTRFVDGTRGTTVATGGGWADLTNNNNHGELVNGVGFDSSNQGSLTFDGVDDYAAFPSLGVFSSNFSIDVWFKTQSFPSSTSFSISPVIISFAAEYSIAYTLGDSIPGDTMGLRVNQNTTWQTPVQTSSLALNTWYNLVTTYDTTNGYRLYKEGLLIDTSSLTGPITETSSTPTNQIGAWTTFSGRYFDGSIPTSKVYNRALTDAEIKQNFNALRGRYGI